MHESDNYVYTRIHDTLPHLPPTFLYIFMNKYKLTFVAHTFSQRVHTDLLNLCKRHKLKKNSIQYDMSIKQYGHTRYIKSCAIRIDKETRARERGKKD